VSSSWKGLGARGAFVDDAGDGHLAADDGGEEAEESF
jgi:hypothetical protein